MSPGAHRITGQALEAGRRLVAPTASKMRWAIIFAPGARRVRKGSVFVHLSRSPIAANDASDVSAVAVLVGSVQQLP